MRDLQINIDSVPGLDNIQVIINQSFIELSDSDMESIAALDKKQSAFFSHNDPNIVEWFTKLIEERKNQA